MKLLSQSKHTDLVYLIKDSDYRWIYSRITQILDKNDASFFASVDIRQSEARWYATDESDYVLFANASDDDKDAVADELAYLQTGIKQKIATDQKLAQCKESLLFIPGEDCIFVYHNDLGQAKVVLTRWGCQNPRNKRDFNPIGKIVEAPRQNRTKVEVLIKWSDGETAANQTFWFFNQYQGRQVTTDNNGRISLGLLKNGSTFTIADANDRSGVEETFEVNPDLMLYTVIFPYYTSAIVHVIDQLDQLVSGCEIKFQHNDEEKMLLSDHTGTIKINRLLYNRHPLVLSLMPDNENSQEYMLERDGNLLIFRVYRGIMCDPRIQVIDKKNGSPLHEYPLNIKIGNGDGIDLKSDINGFITLPETELETNVLVTDLNNMYNNQEYIISNDNHEFIFPVSVPEEKLVKIKLLNIDGDLMPEHPIDITIQGKTYNRMTDVEGYVTFSEKLFVHGKKVKVEVPLNENNS